jgi:hypothetical protein
MKPEKFIEELRGKRCFESSQQAASKPTVDDDTLEGQKL